MSLTTLAEAIILQAAEDFMSEQRRAEDVEFFGGEGFRLCSGIAGMDHSAQCELLNFVRRHVTIRKAAKRNRNMPLIHAIQLHV